MELIPKIEEIEKQKIFTVSEFIDFLNEILIPHQVIVQGEVGGKITEYPRFVIFNLLDKNETAVLNCFAWREKIERLGIKFEEGMEIQIVGYPEIRKNRGEFRFQVERIGLIGEGILKKQFVLLKKKLAKEGLFTLEFKKSIPRFCKKIGLITSRYGRGAKKDFLAHLGNYGFEVYFYDVRVEGISAIDEICRAIRWFNENLLAADTLVLTRGGGSWESLQPFNSEEVAKAIFASKIPIIVGVGHEDDETIADLVADKRASTPTDAAKILSENWKLASINIYDFEKNFNSLINRIFKNAKERINFFGKNLIERIEREILLKQKGVNDLTRNLNLSFQNYFKEFEILEKDFKKNFLKIKNLIKNQKLKIDQFLESLIKNKNWWKEKVGKLLKQQEEKLILSSPILKLKQGYTITSDAFKKIIKDPGKLKISQIIKTKFYKGQVLSKVKKVKK